MKKIIVPLKFQCNPFKFHCNTSLSEEGITLQQGSGIPEAEILEKPEISIFLQFFKMKLGFHNPFFKMSIKN